MTSTTDATDSKISALVLVPFTDPEAARAWAAEHAPSALPPIVTAGTESVWVDPATGEPGYEVTFAGGWRAKYAGSGEVTIGIGTKTVAA